MSNRKPQMTRTYGKRFAAMLSVLLLCCALLMAYFQWGMDDVYALAARRLDTENQQFASEIVSAERELAAIPNLIGEREQELAHAQELLADELDKLPRELDINDVIRTILEMANRLQIKVSPLTTTPLEHQIVNEYEYTCWHVFISATGKLDKLADFVDSIDGRDVPTGAVVAMTVSPYREGEGISSIGDSAVLVGCDLELVVYAISQDNDETFK